VRGFLQKYEMTPKTTIDKPFTVTIQPSNESDYVFNVAPDWLTALVD